MPPRPPPPIPDLLCATPAVRLDVGAMRQLLVFAFATGGSVESFEDALATATLPPTSWDAACFARDIFLDEIVDRCLPVRIGGRLQRVAKVHLARVLASPPRDPEVLSYRRAILAELAEQPAFRAALEAIYLAIVGLRSMLTADRVGVRWLRRLEVLRAIHHVFALLASSFEGATSGLARLPAYGRAVTEGEAYGRLTALLDHEEHLGTVDLRVRVGADGELRTFQIVAVRENTDNPFHSSPVGRLWARLRLLFRGYRMNGGEVLERLFDDVFTGLEGSLVLLFQLLGDIELHLAGLGLRDAAEERGLAVCMPDVDGGTHAFEGLWNPLLLGEHRTPVPCDVVTEHAAGVVVVTGPNSGGKTRLLQAIAIAQMLGEAGLFAPAARARTPRASGLFVSLVEESRADQPEGQLGMELLRIRRMFEQLGEGSLVLLDELCSGTNPSEGEEIARLVLSLLPELGAQVFVTTHLLQFAAHLAEEGQGAAELADAAATRSWTRHLEFFQVELDDRERPTYGFVRGVARTSLAHKTAARLGVTRDELLALIATKRRGSGVSAVSSVSGGASTDLAQEPAPAGGDPRRTAARAGRAASRQ